MTRAAVPAGRAAGQAEIPGAEQGDAALELTDERQAAGLAEHEVGAGPGLGKPVCAVEPVGAVRPAARRASRQAAQRRSVAGRISGQSYIGRAATLTGARPDRMRDRILAAQEMQAEDLGMER